MAIQTFQALKKNLKKDFSGLKKIPVAVLGDTATQLYVQGIKGLGFEYGINFDVFEADYDQIERQAFDLSSELYQFAPEYIILFFSTGKLQKKYAYLPFNQKENFASEQISRIENICSALNENLHSKIILFNFQEVNDSVWGNFANKTPFSFVYQIRKINLELMNLAQKHKNLFIVDLNILQGQYGLPFITDRKILINTDILFSIDFLPIIAKNTVDIILAITGKFNKCLILDLDNTLWGGIIGDEGIENIQIGYLGIGKAFSEFQLWIKQLKQRGIILTVCSKNDEAIAKEPFLKHPDMVIKLEDIAVFVANWSNKADNIRYIQSVLNIGYDSMVFLDDNPFERNLVRSELPQVCIPELPEDPVEYLSCLQKLNLFETASFTPEDEQRTKQYQQEAVRTTIQQQFTNEDEFLQSLNMASVVQPFNSFNIPRVAQLSQRSNQFNLRTVRYTDADIDDIAKNQNCFTFAFTLEDKFGDYGLICVVILKKESADTLFVDTWFMSCRVLKRGMENFVLNTISEFAKANGFAYIKGEYLPTAKNDMVQNHYENLGFEKNDSYWKLDVSAYQMKKAFINVKL